MAIVLRKPIILRFWGWYYSGAVKGLIRAWRNFIIFIREYYSIPLLLRTIFAPWKRDITRRPRGLDIKRFAEVFAFNVISRILGFLVRSVTIVIGSICLVGVIIFGAVALIIWVLLPLVLAFFIIVGLLLLIG